MQAVTTATVQFAVNYVPQCFNANDPYSVLSRFIIIKSMALPLLGHCPASLASNAFLPSHWCVKYFYQMWKILLAVLSFTVLNRPESPQ